MSQRAITKSLNCLSTRLLSTLNRRTRCLLRLSASRINPVSLQRKFQAPQTHYLYLMRSCSLNSVRKSLTLVWYSMDATRPPLFGQCLKLISWKRTLYTSVSISKNLRLSHGIHTEHQIRIGLAVWWSAPSSVPCSLGVALANMVPLQNLVKLTYRNSGPGPPFNGSLTVIGPC